jgi:predicted ATP-grasp superfamily ATP-dependent carboligase
VNPSSSQIDPRRASAPAIVLAAGLNGLCTVRSIGSAGVPVWSVVDDVSQPCAKSKYGRLVLRRSGESVIDLLGRLQREHQLDHGVLLATSDRTAFELASASSSLPDGFRFAGPHLDTVQLLMDKQREIEAIGTISDCLPPSIARLPHSASALLEQLRLPIIFKPRTQEMADALRMKNRVVRTREEVESFLRQHEGALDQFVAQEVIPGGDDTIWQCNAVFDARHALVSAFTFQKLGMSPPHFGVTTLGRSERNAEVIRLASEIGAALGYVGPAGFEFKQDVRDGRFRYIEINPRQGMTNWFDTCCGVNTVLAAYRLSCGTMADPMPVQKNDRYFVDFYSDLFSRLVDDRESAGPVVRRYTKLMSQHRIAAYWAWRDPYPGLVALGRNAMQLYRSGGRFIRRRAAPAASPATPPSPQLPPSGV